MQTLDQIIKEELLVRLAYFHGDRLQVAESLGVSQKTIYLWCHKFLNGLLPLQRQHQEALRQGHVVVLRPEDYRGSRDQMRAVIMKTHRNATIRDAGESLVVQLPQKKKTGQAQEVS